MSYYKTNDAAVLAAWKQYLESADQLDVLGKQFASRFPGAKALFSTNIHSGRSFYGLTFTPPMQQPLWTKPDPKTGYSQFPRRSLPPGTKGDERKALKAGLEKLKEEYKLHKPSGKADIEPFLQAMGLGGGALFFSNYKQFIKDGWVYISTSAKPSAVMVEILGSEFEEAEKQEQQAAA